MLQTSVFVQNRKRKRNGNICVLCHNFWANYDLDLFSTQNDHLDISFVKDIQAKKNLTRNCHKMDFCQ